MPSYPSRTPGPLGSLEDRIAALEGQLRRLSSPTAEQYAQAVASLNSVDSTEGTAFGVGQSGAAASGAFYEWVTMPLYVAPAKSVIKGVVSASAAMVDTTSGGLANLSLRIRTLYPSGLELFSPVFPSAKQTGASAVNNICVGTARVSQVGLSEGDLVEVGIQIAASNPAAFATNSGNFVTGTAIMVSSN